MNWFSTIPQEAITYDLCVRALKESGRNYKYVPDKYKCVELIRIAIDSDDFDIHYFGDLIYKDDLLVCASKKRSFRMIIDDEYITDEIVKNYIIYSDDKNCKLNYINRNRLLFDDVAFLEKYIIWCGSIPGFMNIDKLNFITKELLSKTFTELHEVRFDYSKMDSNEELILKNNIIERIYNFKYQNNIYFDWCFNCDEKLNLNMKKLFIRTPEYIMLFSNFIDQKMACEVYSENIDTFPYIPDKYKTYDMCLKYLNEYKCDVNLLSEIPKEHLTKELICIKWCAENKVDYDMVIKNSTPIENLDFINNL